MFLRSHLCCKLLCICWGIQNNILSFPYGQKQLFILILKWGHFRWGGMRLEVFTTLSCIAGRPEDIAVHCWRQWDTPHCREAGRSSSPGSRTWRSPPWQSPQSFNTHRERVLSHLIDLYLTESWMWSEALVFPGLCPVCRLPALLGTGEVAAGIWEGAAVQPRAGVSEGFLLPSVISTDLGTGRTAGSVISKSDRRERNIIMTKNLSYLLLDKIWIILLLFLVIIIFPQ